jgi:2-amino-4-hydroxy-6-hydroxymethyldihydropteridine diphosphokinase
MIPIVFGLGTNQGERHLYLKLAIQELEKTFGKLECSRTYSSAAVDYTNQPDFLNLVIAGYTDFSARESLERVLAIESKLGRKRDIPRGPRTIDIDILFYGDMQLNEDSLILPHPRLFERSFVVLPLRELSIFPFLETRFKFPESFDNFAHPIDEV